MAVQDVRSEFFAISYFQYIIRFKVELFKDYSSHYYYIIGCLRKKVDVFDLINFNGYNLIFNIFDVSFKIYSYEN